MCQYLKYLLKILPINLNTPRPILLCHTCKYSPRPMHQAYLRYINTSLTLNLLLRPCLYLLQTLISPHTIYRILSLRLITQTRKYNILLFILKNRILILLVPSPNRILMQSPQKHISIVPPTNKPTIVI